MQTYTVSQYFSILPRIIKPLQAKWRCVVGRIILHFGLICKLDTGKIRRYVKYQEAKERQAESRQQRYFKLNRVQHLVPSPSGGGFLFCHVNQTLRADCHFQATYLMASATLAATFIFFTL